MFLTNSFDIDDIAWCGLDVSVLLENNNTQPYLTGS